MNILPSFMQAARSLAAGVAAATLAFSGAVAADHGRTCDFALDGWLVAQVDLDEARLAFQACQERKASCKVERARVRMLEQRVRLLRNYVDRRCRR